MTANRPSPSAFRCDGALQGLAEFSGVEFFISPADLSWTFVRTHEDFALGGPYFVRAEWVEQMRDPSLPDLRRDGRRKR